jgi:nicotinamide-nucleotide amidase
MLDEERGSLAMTPGSRERLASAEIIAVGSEMLAADRVDTNSLFVTRRLNELGIDVVAKAVVGDDLGILTTVFRQALDRADLVVLTGGLGPTDDDLTRQAVAAALERDLQENPAITAAIRTRFERRGLTMPEINRRQALVIDGAASLENPIGSAPGMWIEVGQKVVVLLPGPPAELRPMLERLAAGWLTDRAGDVRTMRRTLRLVGRTESHAEERLRPLYAEWSAGRPPVAATILADRGQIELQLSARAPDGSLAGAALARAVEDVEAAFGADVCSTDGRELEQVIGDLMRARGLRLALAESCTGGLVASRLTDVAGSSDYLDRGMVVYSNQAKVDLLGVPEALIRVHGAVSEPVARAMAEGARRLGGVEVGVGVTGIAGPGGGSDAKPVGTVAMAVAGPGDAARVRTLMFPGNRVQVKAFSSTAALDLLRRVLIGA